MNNATLARAASDSRTHPEANAKELKRDALKERLALFGLCSPSLLLVLVIMIIPVGWLFWLSFVGEDGGFSLENYQRMIDSSSYLEIFRITFEVSAITTAISILIGYPPAHFMSHLTNRVANLCLINMLVHLWTSVLVRRDWKSVWEGKVVLEGV